MRFQTRRRASIALYSLKLIDGQLLVSLRLEVQGHARLVADHPSIMVRRDLEDVARSNSHFNAVAAVSWDAIRVLHRHTQTLDLAAHDLHPPHPNPYSSLKRVERDLCLTGHCLCLRMPRRSVNFSLMLPNVSPRPGAGNNWGIRMVTRKCLSRALRRTATIGVSASLLLGGVGVLASQSPAGAANGDLVGTVTFSQNCGSGIGTGITFDGQYLWVSCYASNPDLLRADPVTGNVSATYNIQSGLGSIAYDASRNAIWAAEGGSTSGVLKIQLDASKNVTGSSVAFDPGSVGLVDGLGYDGTNDTLYWSPDTSTTIYHYTTTGTLLGSFAWSGNACFNSGVAIGGNLLFEGSDGCSHVWVVDKTTLAPAFDFSTVVSGDPNFRDEGLTCDTSTFASQGKQVMWSKEAYSPNRAAAFEIPSGTCGSGGRPATTLTTSLSGGGSSGAQISVTAGTPVTDSATLSGTNAASAGGTVTYTVYSDPNCQTSVASGGTKTVTAGSVPNSDPVTLSTPGTYNWQASYSGDGTNAPSKSNCGDEVETVLQPQASGAFLIGDKSAGNLTVGTQVNFWGAQWAKKNVLTGGSAPAALKGFTDNPTTAACGVNWSTRPGNSASPPGTLPTQIVVIVTSKATKSGPTISGNTVHVVLVNVGPGYGPNPGHAGNGTIAATIC
jgi:hypothetical protein